MVKQLIILLATKLIDKLYKEKFKGEVDKMAVYKDKKRRTWFCIFYINGKQTTRRGFRTKSDALRAEMGYPEQLEVEISRKNVLDKVAYEYIEYLEINQSSSAYSAESLYRLHIKKHFGKKHVNEIKMNDIKELQSIMLKKKTPKGKKYKNKSINHVTSLLKAIMNYAVKYDYIERNPCEKFGSLKIIKTHDDLKFWTDDEFNEAIKHETHFKWYCLLSVLYLTGMRKGEVRGLKWRDMDFKTDIITINRHVNDKIKKDSVKTKEEQKILSGRKNGGSHIVAMDINVKRLLLMHQQHEMMNPDYSEDDYVFGGIKPIGQNTPKRHLDNIAKKAGIKRITVHGLRHSHVSYLISKGLNPYEIADRVGDTVEIVLSVYGHMFPNPQQNIVNTLNENILLNFGEHSQFENIITAY
ncbi:MAG: tyrosine-type recombinase/integrase [Breznakia sp.]